MACESISLQTTSTSLTEDSSLNISFENLNYTARQGIFNRERKVILNDLSGTINSGELTVIVGQSGAGKSTLMDILAGYRNATQGKIYVNGRLRNLKWFRRRSCYILQDDKVQDMLTIEESLTIAAELKLGNHISKEQKSRRIREVITAFALNEVQHTRAAQLSGGQRKRLAIGLELICDSPVMFLDEPTSGLDSSTSKQMVYMLQLLAHQGRTVVVTMHQPSAALLQMVDRLYAVVAGQCAYMGSVDNLIPFFENLNLNCPQFHNPVDFQIFKTDLYEKVFLTTLPLPKEDPTSKILLALKSTYSTSTWKQFTTLTRRSLLSAWRDPQFMLMMTGIHCAMALFVGVLFFNIGQDAKHTKDNYNFLSYSLMFVMFTAFSAVSIKFPQQFPVVRREHFNRWYTPGAYYASTLVAALPQQTVCTLCYSCIAYWLTGQPPEILRFGSFCVILLMVSYSALCMGLLNGSWFDVKHAMIFGPFFVMPFTVFSGFFLHLPDSPAVFRWLFHISFVKHGLVGLCITIYGMGRARLPCSELYCHYTYPRFLLKEVGMLNEQYSLVILAFAGIVSVVVLCTYISLKIRLKSKW
ncbi:ATP-binding cassette subfamily G member 4-like isoform X2 [Leguminivora glycinivorella]|uniref:ATP-binding cassette subfamily G member 4-like isoform X2 n=1 Tax=Leguminivora glycinivorella TaxID=1035111 RepID=UPI00200D90B9|nr:ATP-binding cassette subfamily G member 4-like isoform X2 [Leguminivora glycinivorella]